MQQSTLTPPVSSTRADRIRLTRAATGLNPAEKLLLRSLVDFMGNSVECWPSLSRLAAEVGCSIRHVRRMLRSLESAGWIVSRPRYRDDNSQTSSVFQWTMAPDTDVRPPRTSTSALEIDIQSIQKSNTYAAPAECDFRKEDKTAPATVHVEVKSTDFQPPAAQLSQEAASPAQASNWNSTSNLNISEAASPAQRMNPEKRTSRRFIVIDPGKFFDTAEADRVYHAAVAAKLLNPGIVDRLAFFACWCAVAAKLRAGKVQHPEKMMRFLLDNRKAMSAYPDHEAERKARDLIRKLYPEKAYNPYC